MLEPTHPTREIPVSYGQITPSEANISLAALEALRARVHQEIDEGLLPAAQFAIARSGKLVAFESIGESTSETLFPIFSCTKAITSSLIWMALEAGEIGLDDPVVQYIPQFGTHNKERVTIAHLLTHTAGFPNAPFRPTDYWDPDRRNARFAQWRLDWAPGSMFTYHPSSSMYVLAEILERLTGQGFADLVRTQLAEPLQLPELFVGCPVDHLHRVADVEHRGQAMTKEDYAALGLPEPPVTEVTEEALTNFNKPEIRVVPIPGGGGFMSAATLALWYQSLIGYGPGGDRWLNMPWQEQTIIEARKVRTHGLLDPVQGHPILRGLGIVIAGGEGAQLRGFGYGLSEDSFGHNGAGGQIAWVDPQSELSFVYLTNGHDRHAVRQAKRGIALSSHAAKLTA